MRRSRIAFLIELQRHSRDGPFALLFQDARRFILAHNWLIQHAPLQTYASALLFSPTRSLIRLLFEAEEPDWVVTKPVMSSHWDACLQVLPHDGRITAISFSSDGTKLASASATTMYLWDVMSGQCEQQFGYDSHFLDVFAFSHDVTQMAVGSDTGRVQLWDVKSGRRDHCLHDVKSTAGITSVAFSLNGKSLVSAASDGIVRVWETKSGKLSHALEEEATREQVTISLSPDGSRASFATFEDPLVRVWDSSSGRCVQTLCFERNQYVDFVLSPDGAQLASAPHSGYPKLWDIETGRCTKELPNIASLPFYPPVFSSTGKQLIFATKDRTLQLWDSTVDEVIRGFRRDGWGRTAFSPDDTLLALGSTDGTVRLWDVKMNLTTEDLESHSDYVSSVAVSLDGKTLVSADDGGTLRIWETDSGCCIQRFKCERCHGGLRPISVAISPDNSTVASVTPDGIIVLWDPEHGRWLGAIHTANKYDWDTSVLPGSIRLEVPEFGGFEEALATFDSANDLTCTFVSRPGKEDSTQEVKIRIVRDAAPGRVKMGVTTIREISFPPIQPEDGDGYGYGEFSSHSWITRHGHNVLWIPPEFRPSVASHSSASSVQGRRVTIGCASGRVVHIRFSADGPPAPRA